MSFKVTGWQAVVLWYGVVAVFVTGVMELGLWGFYLLQWLMTHA